MTIKQKIYLIVGLMTLIVVALVFGALRPLFLEIKKTAVETADSKNKLTSFEIIDKGYLAQVETDYRDINSNLELVKTKLIDKSEAVKFFEALESVASSTNNQLEINAADFPVLTLGLVGSYSDFMKLLGWLENGDYFINVDVINIAKVSERETPEIIQSGKVKSTLRINVFTKE